MDQAAATNDAGGESGNELRAANQSLVQKLDDEKKRNEDLLARVQELLSQLDKKETDALLLLKQGAPARSAYSLVSISDPDSSFYR